MKKLYASCHSSYFLKLLAFSAAFIAASSHTMVSKTLTLKCSDDTNIEVRANLADLSGTIRDLIKDTASDVENPIPIQRTSTNLNKQFSYLSELLAVIYGDTITREDIARKSNKKREEATSYKRDDIIKKFDACSLDDCITQTEIACFLDVSETLHAFSILFVKKTENPSVLWEYLISKEDNLNNMNHLPSALFDHIKSHVVVKLSNAEAPAIPPLAPVASQDLLNIDPKSPDGNLLCTPEGIIDAKTYEILYSDYVKRCSFVRFSPNSDMIALADHDWIRLKGIKCAVIANAITVPHCIRNIIFRSNEELLCATRNKLWNIDVKSGALLSNKSCDLPALDISQLILSPQKDMLLLVGPLDASNSSVCLVDLENTRIVKHLTSSARDFKIKHACFSQDGKQIVITRKNSATEIYDCTPASPRNPQFKYDAARREILKTSTNEVVHSLPNDHFLFRSSADHDYLISPDAKAILLYKFYKGMPEAPTLVTYVNLETGERVTHSDSPNRKICDAAFSDGDTVVDIQYHDLSRERIFHDLTIKMRLILHSLNHYHESISAPKPIANNIRDNFNPNQIPWIQCMLKGKCTDNERALIMKTFAGATVLKALAETNTSNSNNQD